MALELHAALKLHYNDNPMRKISEHHLPLGMLHVEGRYVKFTVTTERDGMYFVCRCNVGPMLRDFANNGLLSYYRLFILLSSRLIGLVGRRARPPTPR